MSLRLGLWKFKRILWSVFFRFLDASVSRDPTLWVFELGCDNAINGNLGALLHFVSRTRKIRLQVVASIPAKVEREDLPSGCGLYGVYSIGAAYSFARASAVFVHHRRIDACGKVLGRRRILLNLWHGIPVKGLRYTSLTLYNAANDNDEATSAIIASSKIDALAMSASFYLPYWKVWITGLPRNDVFFYSPDQIPPATRRSHSATLELAKGSRFVLYAPTFRGGSTGSYYSGLYPVTEAEQSELDELLEKHDATLGLRLHGYFGLCGIDPWKFSKRIVDVGQEVAPDANGVLLATDVLVTDYSSIWIDYLLTGRPVIGFVYDQSSYDHDRGMIYNYPEIFPGPMVETFHEFLSVLDRTLTGKCKIDDTGRYDRSRNIFFSYLDGKASERVLLRMESGLARS